MIEISIEAKKKVKMAVARILSSVCLLTVGRRVCMFVNQEDPCRYKEVELERLALLHAMELMDICLQGRSIIQSATMNEKALIVSLAKKTDNDVEVNLSWKLANGVTVSYMVGTERTWEYNKEVESILKKV